MTGSKLLHSILLAGGVCVMLLGGAATARAQQNDQSYYSTPPADADTAAEPGRVARLAYLAGQAQFAPAGENDWGSVDINRPLVAGDKLLTGDDGRAVLELGDASVRIAHDSAFDFMDLAQGNVQIELSQGTLNLAVRQLDQGTTFEVDTPTIAFVASTPGVFRIDNDPDGSGSMVTVFQGSGTVYGERGASRQVVAGTSYRFNDPALANVDEDGLPQADDFDRFCETRDGDYARYAQRDQQYVPPEMIGGDDLDRYGAWSSVPEYGNVWYPTTVPIGWAPYRYGHWAWIGPWGWTWVDNQPWGFAPFHYGRWVHVRNRWGWMPGPVHVRPIYAPALVAFIGGSGFSASVRIGGSPVGWFPLGPRDVYVPWFHASRRYFDRVNFSNMRHGYANRTAIDNFYNDYRHNRAGNADRNHRYAYRHTQSAVTVVPHDVFTGARPVHPAQLKLDRDRLQRTRVAWRPDATPGRANWSAGHPSSRPVNLRGRESFTRPVVVRRPLPSRMTAPLDSRKLPTREFRNTVHPIRARDAGGLPVATMPRQRAPATLPRAPVLRPVDPASRAEQAHGRLPVVQPIRLAPRTVAGDRNVRAPQELGPKATQLTRERVTAQPQRTWQTPTRERSAPTAARMYRAPRVQPAPIRSERAPAMPAMRVRPQVRSVAMPQPTRTRAPASRDRPLPVHHKPLPKRELKSNDKAYGN